MNGFGMFIAGLNGLFCLIAFLNYVLIPRPKSCEESEDPSFLVLIPARNEAENLAKLVPALLAQGIPVIVFDDESTDGTAEVAVQAGATVLRAKEPLPQGWTGKNRGSYALGHAALSDSDAQWFLFLDADVMPEPGFASAVRSALREAHPSVGVITALPKVIGGQPPEPLFMAWVGTILLSTIPIGLVGRVRVGHARFLNGQFHAWRREVYAALDPNERVKGRILEDVMMARLCAAQNVRVDTVNLTQYLSVRMYQTWRQALDGMSKNSYEIAGNVPGSIFLAVFLLFWGFGWVLAGPWLVLALSFLVLTGVAVGIQVRASTLLAVLMPVALSIGAFTVLRSIAWHRQGKVVWKGRTYPGN
ncbi:MAG: glycosyltransferase [Fimbriimonas sp.]